MRPNAASEAQKHASSARVRVLIQRRKTVEYNQSFAVGEAIVLVGFVAWLIYINSPSSGSHSSSESSDRSEQKSGGDDSDRT